MTEIEFIDHNKRLLPELEQLISRTLQVKIGAKAKSLFQENFRKGGFQYGGLHVWQVIRRQLLGKEADAQRGPLLSSRLIIYKGIAYIPKRCEGTIYFNDKYAAIHNEGETVVFRPRITANMRCFAWANQQDFPSEKS